MIHLIQRGLMFGNLIHIAAPALVERYNRALKHLTQNQTNLNEFHIDISGYSPEIGDELDDHLYLNHAGVNRQFILLTTDQKSSPLLNAKFSTSRKILKEFITKNEPQLFALTARDAVAGELVNSVYAVTSPERLFDIRRIEIEADTTKGTLRDADIHKLETCRNIALIRFDGSLYFANTCYFEDKVLERAALKPDLKYVIIDAEGINEIDATGEEMLHHLAERLGETGVELLIARAKKQVWDVLSRTGFIDKIGEDHMFALRTQAFNDAWDKLGDNHAETCPLRLAPAKASEI